MRRPSGPASSSAGRRGSPLAPSRRGAGPVLELAESKSKSPIEIEFQKCACSESNLQLDIQRLYASISIRSQNVRFNRSIFPLLFFSVDATTRGLISHFNRLGRPELTETTADSHGSDGKRRSIHRCPRLSRDHSVEK